MQRVLGVGRDLRVAPRRLEPARRERRVVAGVNQVVRAAGMVRVGGEHPLREVDGGIAGGLPLGRREVADVGGEHRGERGERRRIQVVRIREGHDPHRVREPAHPHGQRAVDEQRLDRLSECALPRRAGLRQPRVARGAQPSERAACGVGVVLAPQQMAVGQRLAPERHGERRIGRLRRPERLGRLVVLEAVEQGEAALERRGCAAAAPELANDTAPRPETSAAA